MCVDNKAFCIKLASQTPSGLFTNLKINFKSLSHWTLIREFF